MKIYETEIINEIYDILINSSSKENLNEFLNKHPYDIVKKYFILNHIEFIKYNSIIFNSDLNFFNYYKIYFCNSYIHYGEFSYNIALTTLIKNYNKNYILELHNNLMSYFKDELFKKSMLKREYFIYLTNIYDTQFNKRLKDEINNINFNYLLIKDNLEEDDRNIIKNEYKYLEIESD